MIKIWKEADGQNDIRIIQIIIERTTEIVRNVQRVKDSMMERQEGAAGTIYSSLSPLQIINL